MSASPRRLLLALALALPAAASGDAPRVMTLVVKGSDTIGGALGPALARAYQADHPDIEIRWEGLGSSTAFPGLFDGSADIGAASRTVNDAELADAKELGIQLQEHILGYDGIAVVVNPTNPVRQLTLEQVSALFTGRARSWSEVGGTAQPVKPVSRPSYSGTHAFFKEKVLRGGRKGATDEFPPGTTFIEKTEDVVHEVARDPGAIAYVGMGTLRPGVTVVAIAGGAGKPFLLPSPATVRSGTYAIHRPLLLYTRGEPRGEVRRFLAYVMGEEGHKLIAAHDFIPSDVTASAELTSPAVDPAPAPEKARIYRIHFAYGHADLDDDAKATLEKVYVAAIRRRARLHLIGNSDAAGDPEGNRRVALVRVRGVATELRHMGFPRESMALEVRGADMPLATNGTAAGRRENRRVDIEIIPPARILLQ